jgi:methyl coenzyme M reductase subunit C
MICIPYEIKNSEMGGECGTIGEIRCADRVLVGKSDGKRPLERPRCKWEYNIKIGLQETEWRLGLD